MTLAIDRLFPPLTAGFSDNQGIRIAVAAQFDLFLGAVEDRFCRCATLERALAEEALWVRRHIGRDALLVAKLLA